MFGANSLDPRSGKFAGQEDIKYFFEKKVLRNSNKTKAAKWRTGVLS